MSLLSRALAECFTPILIVYQWLCRATGTAPDGGTPLPLPEPRWFGISDLEGYPGFKILIADILTGKIFKGKHLEAISIAIDS
jgi:hypothetical protein